MFVIAHRLSSENLMKSLPAIVFVLLCSPLFAADKTEKQVRDLVQHYDSAWLKKDVAEVQRILAPEYIYFSSEGKLTDRRSTFDFLQKNSYKLDRSERSEVEVHRTDHTVVVSSRWIGKGTYDGKPIDDDQRCDIVLSQVKGKWLIVSEHCTQIAK
jgi:ketosteroid isomerase-like protein